ncbi:MAG: M10 family metallopeptidase C-terminal domain-containing protein, partial [Sphingomicrobium sp.]
MPDIPGNNTTTATIAVGQTVSGSLETLGDHDWFRITLTAGQSITVFVDGTTLEDSYLYIRDSAGSVLFENDDISSGVNRDSQLSFSAPVSGTYYIDVGSYNNSYTGDYQVSVSVYTPPPLATYDQIANQLVEGYWGGDDHHFNVTQGGSITVNVTALTPGGQTLARAALAEWTDIIGVQFIEVSSGGQITFDDNQTGAATDANWAGGIISSAHVNVSTAWLADYGTSLNSYSFQTYIHEIGHALGLGHAGNYNGSATYPYDASFQNDAWVTSIMSYFDQADNTYFAGQGFSKNFVVTPMMADILAMSTLYGLSTTTRTGDTTYGFNSNTGLAIYNASANPGVGYTIFDSGGIDTLDYSGFNVRQQINLNAETFSNVGPGIGNVAIARGVVIENAITGGGNDSLTGNAAANILTGNAGNDTLNGGAGADTLIGGFGNDIYIVDQAGDVIIEGANAGTDMLVAKASYVLGTGVEVETMTTINASATTSINLTGNEFAQSLYGNAGDNILTGMGGSDYLVGGAGNDQYYVDTSDFIAEANGGGDDTIYVADSYILREGSEIETLVAVNQDSLDPVNLTGNEYGQSLYGSQGVNSLNGGAGNDYLVGLGGNDFLLGGAGNDNMAGGQGNDIYYVDSGDWVIEAAGEGDDRAVAFSSFVLRTGESVETLAAAEGTSAINLTGNALAQSLYGNAG